MEEILAVSQSNNDIKFILRATFDLVLVEGEVSKLWQPQSGQIETQRSCCDGQTGISKNGF
jgi:exonuclease VII large subunit